MTDEFAPNVAYSSGPDLRQIVTDGVKDAADRIGAAVEAEQRPGRSLDVLAQITRQTPLVALLAAFAVGAIVARRRRW
jgi:MYXO-CTERM domain-containing protein